MKSTLLKLLFAFTFLSSCQKENLVAVNQTSLDYLRCKMNGTAWQADRNYKGEMQYSISMSSDLHDLTVSTSDSSLSSSFHFNLANNQKITIGNYLLNNQNIAYFSLFSSAFSTDASQPGLLTITHLDTDHRSIIGTFAFDAYGAWHQDSVHITDGRFSLHY